MIELLESSARTVSHALSQSTRKGLLLSHGDSAIHEGLCGRISNPMDNVSICSALNQAIWQLFRRQGITVPFLQQLKFQMVWPPRIQQPNLAPH